MDFTTIFQAALTLIAAIITGFLVPWIKAKTTTEQQSTISTWIDTMTAAAEQLFDSDQGAEKLAYVQSALENLGITVTTEEIESSVYWLHSVITEEVVDGE